jgi:hypothetical protein
MRALRVGPPEGSVNFTSELSLAFSEGSVVLRVPQISVQIEGCASPRVGKGAMGTPLD